MSKIKVLIAEDDRDIIEVLRLYVESNDMEALVAEDGKKPLISSLRTMFPLPLWIL